MYSYSFLLGSSQVLAELLRRVTAELVRERIERSVNRIHLIHAGHLGASLGHDVESVVLVVLDS